MLNKKKYYINEELLEIIKTEFNLIESKGWFELYQHKLDGTFWKLDIYDKYQTQFFVQLETADNWESFDDRELRIELLKETRGIDLTKKCIWNKCDKPSLQGLAYCEMHAFIEMGIRK